MFNPRAYDNSRPDGIAALELVAGDLAGQTAEVDQPGRHGPAQAGAPILDRPWRRFVPLKRTALTGDVAGPLASLRVTHVFGFPPDQWGWVWPAAGAIEALYRFPLPGDAAVTGVRVRFGDVEIEAHLAERQQAEEEYDTARREGRQATLLTRESPDVFTLRVAGITAGQDVTVQTAYVQLARPEGAGWTLRVPLTTAPRYVRSDEVSSRPAQGQPLGLLRDPGHRFALDVRFCGAATVESATHQLASLDWADAARPGAGGTERRVMLQQGEIVPDRDLVLSWRPAQDRTQPAGQVWLHDAAESDRAYFLALVAPPLAPAPDQRVPRELVVLVDHSGSMEGPKWAAADWAVKQLLADLDERERFTLGVFHNTTAWLANAPGPATIDAVRRAYHFLETHRDSGGTELGVALEQAVSLSRSRGEYARHVIVITDAQVSDAGRIVRLAEQEARRSDRRRVSVLCIDAAPNSFLALDLAERGGGVARFLTSAPEEEDIATALDDVLAAWARPVVAGVRLEVNRRRVEATGGEALPANGAYGGEGRAAIALGDLPAGRSVWVAGRVPRGGAAGLRFRLSAAGGRELAAEPIELATETLDLPAVKALFGARRVLALEHLMHAGYPPEDLARRLAELGYNLEEVLSGANAGGRVYAENARRDQAQVLRGLLVREALEFGLASLETAFVATRTEAGQHVQQTVEVANALPAGWSEEFLMLRAAGGPVAAQRRRGGAARGLRVAAVPPPTAMPPDAALDAMVVPKAMPVSGAAAAPVPPQSAPAGGGLRDQLRRFVRERAPRQGAADRASFALRESDASLEAAEANVAQEREVVIFSGPPQFSAGQAVLFDSTGGDSGQHTSLPEDVTFSSIRVRLLDGAPPHDELARLDPDLRLLIFVDDLVSPRAQVRLADLFRQQGERPLNLLRRAGPPVRIVLADPNGAWAAGAPRLEVSLGW